MNNKYRAWDKMARKFVIINTFSFDENGCIISIKIGDRIYSPNEFVLIKYIGFQDANKKDIYEGDILKDRDGKVNVVVWYDKLSGYILGSWLKEGKEKDIDFQTLQEKIVDCTYFIAGEDEIIGNILQNPELLEEK